MKKVILEMSQMSDSKEVYRERPNPFIAAFIYSLTIIVIAALIYSYFGKIEVVTTAVGEVRPNEDVSTVTTLLSGKITEVCCADGDVVEQEDVLFKIDTVETEITLESLKDLKDDCDKEIVLQKKFLSGIENGKNPFKNNPNSKEYPYYIQYREFSLAVKDSETSTVYDRKTLNANISEAERTLEKNRKKLEGLKAYKESIESGKNKAEAYPEESHQYLLYEAGINELTAEYEAQKKQIEADATAENSSNTIRYYQNQIDGYNKLIMSIEKGESQFTQQEIGVYKQLYDDYLYNATEYERVYNSAKENYEYYVAQKEKLESESEADGEEPEDGTVTEENGTISAIEMELSAAKTKMDSAYDAIISYKNKTLINYRQIVSELEKGKADASITIKHAQSKSERLKELHSAYENSKKQLYLSAITQAETLIENLENDIKTAESNLELYYITESMYEKNVDEEGVPMEISIATVKQISFILANIDNLKKQSEELALQIVQATEQIKQGVIKAAQSGIVNGTTDLVKGDLITAGTPVATIIPINENEYKVQIYVSNADIADIEVGDEVKYNISAMPSNQYGTAKGHITKISKDSILQEGQHSGYFLAEATIEERELTDMDGNKAEVSIGMQVQAKIITQEKRILNYLLEKLNIFW